ncbi:unnamed protein product [marine sediment metagenome]|uniref:Uncharacterized protein n=1 Tax=marine sediment metagenome TaxID=412755 RepID=X1PHZ1_9ZZZZ
MTAKLKNYTTSVPAERSIGQVQALLIEFGAEKIMLEAKDKRVFGVTFAFMVNGKLIPFKLPTNDDQVLEYIWNDYKKGKSRYRKTKDDLRDDAYNIAWRIIKDWVHAQLSIIAIGLVRPEEVFLPYLYDGSRTLAEKFTDGDLKKLLPEFKGES